MRLRREALALMIVPLFALAACNGGDVDPEPSPTPAGFQGGDRVVGELHECAEELPVPDGVSVVESVHTQVEEGFETCVVTMETRTSAGEMTASYRAALDAEGWRYAVQQDEPTQGFMQLEDPLCGVLMILPSDAAGREEAGAPTTVLVSLLPCEQMPPAPQG